MSGKEPIGNAVDQILQNVDWASIADERVREGVRLLLNLLERVYADLRKAQAENDYLREQLQARKGGGGPGSGSSEAGGAAPRSSEKERKEPRESHEPRKQRKLERIRIDREEVLKVDRATLPADAEFKGYEEVVVQDVHLRTDNVKFRKEKYYSASRGKTYLAPLPAGYGGEYGPHLKTFCLLLSHLGNMTEPKIADLLRNLGIVISSGQISRLLALGGRSGCRRRKKRSWRRGWRAAPGSSWMTPARGWTGKTSIVMYCAIPSTRPTAPRRARTG